MKKKYLSLFVTSSLLLAACGTTDLDSGTTVSNSEVSDSTSSMISSISEESSSILVESESEIESSNQNSTSESSSVESMSEESTELNQDEAMMIERAKEKITELTGYVEGDEHLYLVDGIEGSIVDINVRENGEEVASSLGFYKYDDSTDSLQEMDILTGEYEDFPANE